MGGVLLSRHSCEGRNPGSLSFSVPRCMVWPDRMDPRLRGDDEEGRGDDEGGRGDDENGLRLTAEARHD